MAIDRRTTSPPAPLREGLVVILNGNARSVTADVVSLLTQVLPVGDVFVTHRAEDVPAFARTALDRGVGTVMTGGGDGTFMHVVSEVCRLARERGVPPPRFGVLRLGTGNAIGYSVGASAPDARGLGADILSLRDGAGTRAMRLLDVEGRLTPFAGVGLDAMILNDYETVRDALAKTPFAKLGTGGSGYAIGVALHSVRKYLTQRPYRARVINDGEPADKLDADGRRIGAPIAKGETLYDGPVKMASAATIPYYGMGFRMFPFTEERPDRMHLRMTTAGTVELLSNLPRIWKGRYFSDRIIDFLCTRVRIDLDRPTPLQIGGDAAGERSSVVFALADEAIELVDYRAPG